MVQPGKLLFAVFLLTAILLSVSVFSVAEEVGVPSGVGSSLPGEDAGVPPNVGGLLGEEVGVPPNVGVQVCTSGSRRWGILPESMPSSLCPDGWLATVDCNAYGQWQLVACYSSYDSFTPVVVDNSPTATISVTLSAAPNSQLNLIVTGTDDKDVSQLLLYDSNSNLLGSFSCTGVQTSCTATFMVTAPSTFSTSYTFKARSMDSAGQLSAFVSGNGATTAAPPLPPVVPPVVQPAVPPAPVPSPSPIAIVSVSAVSPASPLQAARFPLQPLFMRSVSFPDSDCVRPGESALLAVKVQNTGKTTLKDVSFTATVPEAGIYAKSGPVSITTKGKLTRFLRLDVPSDAGEGDYYLRLTVSNSKSSRSVYRIFTVDSSC